MRQFESGATRDSETDKLDYEGFLSPWALQSFANYMHKHRVQADGSLRDSDNWQKGIPVNVYIKSAWRHFMDLWMALRTDNKHWAIESANALLFNVQGILHELIVRGL